MISEQFNDFSSLNNMTFNLFIHCIHYSLQCFSQHLNWHNIDFLLLYDAFVYAVSFLVRTINLLKNYCTIVIRHYCSSGNLNAHNNDFLVCCDAYVYVVPLLVCTIKVLKMN